MRLSVELGDPGYQPSHITRFARVTLNGQELRSCITADEEAGIAIVHKFDRNGRPVVVGGDVLTETLHGVVRIEAPKL